MVPMLSLHLSFTLACSYSTVRPTDVVRRSALVYLSLLGRYRQRLGILRPVSVIFQILEFGLKIDVD